MAKRTPPPVSLPDAVDRGDWNTILEARRNGTPWQDLRTHQGMPALLRAVVDGNTLMVRHMLEAEAPVGAVVLNDGTWMSPLWAAIERGQPAIVSLLLEAGADPNMARPKSDAPIVLASQQRMGEACKALLFHGAQLNAATIGLAAWMRHGLAAKEQDHIDEVLDVTGAFVKAGCPLPQGWAEWLQVTGEDPRWTGESFRERISMLQRTTDRQVIEQGMPEHVEPGGWSARI